MALEGMMKADPSQDFSLKESLHGEEEEDYTVDEVAKGNVEALVQPLLDDQQPEILLLSGPLNPWRHSGLRTQSPHQDMTILQLTDGHLSLMARNLGMGLLRVAEKGLVDPDQHDPPGKINLPASGG